MNPLELGCLCLTAPHLKIFMEIAGIPGNGAVAALIGVVLFAYGHYRADEKTRRLGMALFISLLAVAVLTTAMKYSLRLPRPMARSSFGFPSGDSATAFTLAAVTGAAYPTAAPLLFFGATLTAISRLYVRAHYVWDVIGGALLGCMCGYLSARKFALFRRRKRGSLLWFAGWLPGLVLWILVPPFFLYIEHAIDLHKLPRDSRMKSAAASVRVDFAGTANTNLLNGWTRARAQRAPNAKFAWVENKQATLLLPVAQARKSRMLIRAFPYQPEGFLCQRALITINGEKFATVWLEQGWHNYALEVPGRFLRSGDNRIVFSFPYSDNRNWHGMNPQKRPLSAAFRALHLTPISNR